MKPVFLFLFFLFLSPIFADLPQILPPALQKGDTIMVVAPASPPEEDQVTIARGIKMLMLEGYRVVVAPNLVTRHGYLAGTDYDRAKAFMDAWQNKQVKAIWCYRGGFGCTRILERLDFQVIRENPKILIGMSDITALHAAINKKTGLVTFLGPNMNAVFGKTLAQDSSFNQEQLFFMIAPRQTLPAAYKVPWPSSFPTKAQPVVAITEGVGRGKLTGGTLSLVSSLIGTPWAIDTKGKILVLEEVDEEPYRIDRMLRQLKQAGLLDEPAGVVLSSWRGCSGKRPTMTLKLEKVFKDYFASVKYPVLFGFPSGHIKDQVTLPLNSVAELNTHTKSLHLLQTPVTTL